MFQTKKKQAFTLVELIITITILGILATIAFVSFQNYFWSSRDSVRVSDIKTIHNGLSIYKVKSWKSLLPDEYITIQAGSNILSFQWEIWEDVKRIINISGKASDPQTQRNYLYTTDKNQNKFQLMWYLETIENIRYIWLISQAQAQAQEENNEYTDKVVYVYGDKIWVITDENKTPIQYTLSSGINEIDLSSETYQDQDIIIYLGWDAYDGGKVSTSGWNGWAIIESSLNGELLCGETSYSWYTLFSTTHNQIQIATKQIDISNGTQQLQLQVRCINWDWDISNSTESITNTHCSTEWYVAHDDECILNQCWGNLPQDHYSVNASNISHEWVWNYSESSELCTFECEAWYTYDGVNNLCTPNNCTTPTSWEHSGLTYSLISQPLNNGQSITIISENRNFWSSPTHGVTKANFTFSCNAGSITITSTANHSWSCTTSGYTFNNDYSSPACILNTCLYQWNITHWTFTYNYALCPDGKFWTTTHLKHTPSTWTSRCYNNIASNCTNYGRLYNLAAANSICQTLWTGWRLPGWEWIEMRERFSSQIPASLWLVNTFPWYRWNWVFQSGYSMYWTPFTIEWDEHIWSFWVESTYWYTSFASDTSANQSTSGFSVLCIKDL